jgi:hypothetical protein
MITGGHPGQWSLAICSKSYLDCAETLGIHNLNSWFLNYCWDVISAIFAAHITAPWPTHVDMSKRKGELKSNTRDNCTVYLRTSEYDAALFEWVFLY